MKSPCQNCMDRHKNCHSECGSYKAFKFEMEFVKKLQQQDNNYLAYYTDVNRKIRKRGEYGEYAKK